MRVWSIAGTSARAAARRAMSATACAGVAPIDSHPSTSGHPAPTASVSRWPASVVAVMEPPTSWATNGTAVRADSGRAPLANTTAAAQAAPAAIAAGAGSAGAVVFACGALPLSARTAVPFVAQLVGGSMTATTLAGQRLTDAVSAQWPEVEAWLSIGATPAQAVADMARRAAGRALVPAVDQTRNVGLVVLPGAYVGLLLGGASPLEAGRVQLLVLVGLLAAETVAAVVVTRLLAPALGALRPPG